MSYRGRHERDYVEVGTGYDLDGCFSYYIEYEKSNTKGKGSFFVIKLSLVEGYVVCWRPTKNATTMFHTYTMRLNDENGNHPIERATYPSLHEAIASIDAIWATDFEIPAGYARRASTKTRDSQRSKVYKWEHMMAMEIGPKVDIGPNPNPNFRRDILARAKLENKCSRDFMQSMLEHVCYNLGEKTPELKFRSGGVCSYGGTDIRLLDNHCTRLILLHELAHVLHRRWGRTDKYGKLHAGHGKEFVGIYCYLLIRFGEVDQDKLIQHMLKHRIKYEFPRQFHDWISERDSVRLAA